MLSLLLVLAGCTDPSGEAGSAADSLSDAAQPSSAAGEPDAPQAIEEAALPEPEQTATATEVASSEAENPSQQTPAPQDSESESASVSSEEPSPVPTTTSLPRAGIGFDQLFDDEPGRVPVSIEIENINVRDAEVIPVGVNQEDLTFEVPPADQVGWYEFGSSPGEAGSSVLAAHIAYNGVDGVFRYLEDVEVGSVVTVGFDDGTTQRYRIEEVVEYVKEALPDSLFARDGREQLALITCGGSFNRQLNSYDSNTVAVAVPI